jgi:hypothetical protein
VGPGQQGGDRELHHRVQRDWARTAIPFTTSKLLFKSARDWNGFIQASSVHVLTASVVGRPSIVFTGLAGASRFALHDFAFAASQP